MTVEKSSGSKAHRAKKFRERRLQKAKANHESKALRVQMRAARTKNNQLAGRLARQGTITKNAAASIHERSTKAAQRAEGTAGAIGGELMEEGAVVEDVAVALMSLKQEAARMAVKDAATLLLSIARGAGAGAEGKWEEEEEEEEEGGVAVYEAEGRFTSPEPMSP